MVIAFNTLPIWPCTVTSRGSVVAAVWLPGWISLMSLGSDILIELRNLEPEMGGLCCVWPGC